MSIRETGILDEALRRALAGGMGGRDNDGQGHTTIDATSSLPAPRHGLLILTHGPGKGRLFPIGAGDGPVRIGRASTCEICIDDPSLSRVHATLTIVGPDHAIVDEGSRNGTFRNGIKLEYAATIEDGDRLTLGDVRLRFVRADDAETDTLLAVGRRQEAGAAPRVALRRVVRTSGLRRVFDEAERAAKSGLSVLILGETGVGKEVFAEAIHEASPRANKELLSFNCAALTESLLESELFGHERGAFTGAVTSKIGLIEAANGGTVFFDEVGELPLSTQAKLLRVLEDRRVMRVGARTAKAIDVRFVAATNRDLAAAVEAGSFRRDLFYRLNAITLELPPLRARPSDILELADALLVEASALAGGPSRVFHPAARDALLSHDWPGNVRELRNVIERAVVLSDATELTPEMLALGRGRAPSSTGSARAETRGAGPLSEASLASAVDSAERERVLAVLEAHAGNQTHAAVALGISRRTLVARLTQWGMTRPRSR